MATRIYGCPPGANFSITSVVEAIGPVATSAPICLIVDLATNIVTDGAVSRGIERDEVIKALDTMKARVMAGSWPPA